MESQIIAGIVIFVLVWMVLVAFAPFRCTHSYCGYKTWNPWNMLKHVERKHTHE